jgi:lipid-binding SYLF domain-containing protein
MNRVLCWIALFLTVASWSVAVCAAPSKDERRQDVRDVTKNTLERLYQVQPKARDAVERSAGYAAFSNFGMKILFAGGGKGAGMAVNRKTGAETYMKMVEVQAGLGIGVKKFRVIWVFEKQSDLDRFINSGWEVGGQATATAQVAGKGQDLYSGAMSISPGVWLYQLTDEGVAAELTAKGTKYFKDPDL